MRTRRALVKVAILFLNALSAGTLQAQQQIQLQPLRFDLSPFVGYRTSASFPIEPHVSGTNPRLLLDASPSYGVSFGIRVAEDDLIEIRWARQSSHIRSQDVDPSLPRHSLILDQLHGDFSHEYLIEDWVSWARPFVMASIGATHVSGRDTLNFTRFSFGIGGGVRFYPSRHVGFKIQAEWLPIVVDPQVAFVCGPGCIVHVSATVGSQGEVILGPVFRF